MKKTILLTILIISLALTGCALKKNVEVGNNSQNGKAQNTANENTQVANPASLFCIEKGGKSQIVETEAGQAGICKFDDGSECDEWAFFRKECQPGQTDNVQIPSGQTGITISGIKDGQTIYSPLVVFGRAPVEKDVLVVELRNAKHETLVKEKTNIDDSGFYSIKLNFEFNNTKEGFVAVYEQGEDGSELNLVEIPVKFGNLNISTDWQTYKNIDISNWQTYKSEKYGFEVKYPEKWDVFINKDTGITWDNYEIWTEGLVSVFEIKNTKKDEFVGCSSGGPGIPVEGMSFRIVISKKGDKTFNTIINDCIAHSEEGKCETGVEILNGNETLILYDRNTPCNYPSAYVIKKDFVYNIETVWNNMSDRVEYYEELYYEMLNTIKIVP